MQGSIKEDGSWVESELSFADFSELRLNKRFQILAKQLAEFPTLSINKASVDWASSKAAYRFFDNPKVDYKKIIEPHILSTTLRTKGHNRIVVVQDTSMIDFSKHKGTSGLGLFHDFGDGGELKGLSFHVGLALTDRGLPLGLLYERLWARERQKIKGHAHTKIPMEKKESFRWLEALRQTNELVHEETEVVMVCDREADIYELFEEALDLRMGLVVRLQHDRVLDEEEFGELRIFDRLGLEKACGHVTIEIPSSGSRKARKADLEIRFAKVTLASRPRGLKTKRVVHRSDIDLWVVDLRELKPPKGVEPLSWTLISTVEVRSKDCLAFFFPDFRRRSLV